MDERLVRTTYYRQFDADLSREHPAEGYEGWATADLPLSLSHSALIVMHAWAPAYWDLPGWLRTAEFLARSERVLSARLAPLLNEARAAGLTVVHVVAGSGYFEDLPGYQRTRDLLPGDQPDAQPPVDQTVRALREFRLNESHPGRHNRADVERGLAGLQISPEVFPEPDEWIASTGAELDAICKEVGLSHLLYTGFALNACLTGSPGGIVQMSQAGYLCSVVRDCVTAIESHETARVEGAKGAALYQVALLWGFPYDSSDLIEALKGTEA